MKIHVSIKPDQDKRIDELIEDGIFESKSHAIRECIKEGIPIIEERHSRGTQVVTA